MLCTACCLNQAKTPMSALTCRPPVPSRYLVSADGSTAAWRLATVLMKNSLVIKQASPRVEYYCEQQAASAA